jgi:mycothiol synthase
MSSLRPPTEDDAGAVARLMNEHWPEPLQEDVVRSRWSSPTFDLAQDARLEEGGYAHVADIGGGRAWIDLQGHPSARLVDWAEERARAVGARRLLSGFWLTNDAVRDQLVSRGYLSARHSQRMTIELGELTEEPVWPHGVEVHTLRPGEERAFYEAHQEAFEDTWEPIRETYDEWSHSLLRTPQFDPDLWFAGRAGSELGGIAICSVRRGDPDVGLVYILGVRRPWRGIGLGRALLVHSLRAFQRRGLERAVLGVDSDNPSGAHRLYESVGMVVTARFEIYEKAAA